MPWRAAGGSMCWCRDMIVSIGRIVACVEQGGVCAGRLGQASELPAEKNLATTRTLTNMQQVVLCQGLRIIYMHYAIYCTYIYYNRPTIYSLKYSSVTVCFINHQNHCIKCHIFSGVVAIPKDAHIQPYVVQNESAVRIRM